MGIIVDPTDPRVLGSVLGTIRSLESAGRYTAQAKGSSASGAYQMVDGTWRHYAAFVPGAGGYARAAQAPAAVQDLVAAVMARDILSRYGNDLEAVPAAWYTGSYNRSTLDQVPVPGAGNTLTVRQYQRKWLDTYQTSAGQRFTGAQRAATDLHSAGEGAMVPGYLYSYGSGKMPTSTLTSIGRGQYLAPDPAAAYNQLRSAAEQAGFQVQVTDSFRSYANQESEFLKRYRPDPNGNRTFRGQKWALKGGYAQLASPGQSLHGYGYAMDIFDARGSTYTKAFHTWLAANAGQFGWANTVRSEGWHYVYQGDGSAAAPGGGGTPLPMAGAPLEAPKRRRRSTTVVNGVEFYSAEVAAGFGLDTGVNGSDGTGGDSADGFPAPDHWLVNGVQFYPGELS